MTPERRPTRAVGRWLMSRERVTHWSREADAALLEARAQGFTYDELGRAAGILRQSAWEAVQAAERRVLLRGELAAAEPAAGEEPPVTG